VVVAVGTALGSASPAAAAPVWQPVPALPKPRAELTGASIGGVVYVAGGLAETADGRLNPVRTLWALRPGAASWQERARLPGARYAAHAVALPGELYVLGGRNAGGVDTGTVFRYTPSNDSWDALARPSFAPSAAARGGYLVFAFGEGQVAAYDPEVDTWSPRGAMPDAAQGPAVFADGRIHLVGGEDAWSYDPVLGTWEQGAARPFDLGYPYIGDGAAAVLGIDGRIYLTGGGGFNGFDYAPTNVTEVYAPATDTWSLAGVMPTYRAYGAAARVGNRILAIGGYDENEFFGESPLAAVDALPTTETEPPDVAHPPVLELDDQYVALGGILARARMGATDPSGIAGMELHRSIDGTVQPLAHAWEYRLSRQVFVKVGRSYSFESRASDRLGNVSELVAGPASTVRLTNNGSAAIKSTGSWSTLPSPEALGHSVAATSEPGAMATFRFTGRSVGWVFAYGAENGRAEVLVDGEPVTIVDLYSPSPAGRAMFFTRSWLTAGEHTVQVRALGTKGHPRVVVDAFLWLA
jgi:hypothetical protein